MVKIDGTKIRSIREQKGLTQLYVATVVEVTTDTVSRWENNRYPTIKKENGLKLAEALEVELDEILDSSEKPVEPIHEQITATAESGDSLPPPLSKNEITESPAWYRKPGHLSILIILLLLIGGIWAVFHYVTPQPHSIQTVVSRIVSPHFIAGRPLPVFLKINNPTLEAVSIILKEDLPPGTTLSGSVPVASGSHNGTIKWLAKISGSNLFFYTITTEESFSGTLSFSGSVRDGHGNEPQEIRGSITSQSGLHHWADTDGDNRISDEEILEVYDLFANDMPPPLDLDLLEEMWLGEGYLWQPEKQQFSIIQ